MKESLTAPATPSNSYSLLLSIYSEVLEEMEMLSAFTSVLHVPNLSSPEHVLAVLEQSDIFSKGEIQAIGKKMSGKRCVSWTSSMSYLTHSLSLSLSLFHSVFIGIKKLLGLIDMARQTEPSQRAIKFLSKMEEEGGLDMVAR